MFDLLDIFRGAPRARASGSRWLARALSAFVLAALGVLWLGSPASSHAAERTRANRSASAPSGNPLATLQRDADDAAPSLGSVEQRLAAGSYTYLALRLDNGELRWLVTLGKAQPVGTHVRIRSFGHRDDFYSRRLRRTFAVLAFGFVSRLD
jgi:hypothetical protein